MLPVEHGRHCNACSKKVVDFTTMNDEEVKRFFIGQQGQSVCGRFKNEQLYRIRIKLPHNINQIAMPCWKQFLTALLMAFSSMLFSCDVFIDHQPTLGVPMVEHIKDNLTAPPTSGMIQVKFDNRLQKETKEATVETVKFIHTETITGDIQVLPDEPFSDIPVTDIMIEKDSTSENIPVNSMPDSNHLKQNTITDSVNCNNQININP
jgi:hypothetical protein